ncbi:FAD-binding domain-containing protein [Paraphaeosphaeria sporulosa]|uniref:FAD-binding domain-containing protein n=1 Tax=Paraphaeosphaeria sporulosa TaxID=1460663 RepID=A0A177CV72_9PLEO|nr:FAD-binding domain-containing protein [Paraphaeosphaeria sporulosa]OAG11455.1 FAD-binding domain-containing protein [Paraphaeosphaeria sporulosa]
MYGTPRSETAWKVPSCIFEPSDSTALADAVKIISSNNITFAVRSGGHSPFSNWANVDGGVLISLSAINAISYNPTDETVRVGTGNQWGQVYGKLAEYDRVVVGGRVPDVGFGLLTGGGLSHHSSLYGFAADNVIIYEVVLSNGTEKTVSRASDPEHFWALKAGGTNFGIISYVTLKAFPQGKVWGGVIFYSIEYLDQIMAAIAEYQAVGQLDPRSAILPYVAFNNFNSIFISFSYLDAVERPEVFNNFYRIPSLLDDTKIHNNFSASISEVVDKVYPRWTWGSTTFYLDNSTYVQVARLCQNISRTDEFQAIQGATLVLVPQPVSRAMVQRSVASGEHPMNLRDREQIWFSINLGWQYASDDARMEQFVVDTLSSIEKLTKSKGLFDEYVFFNNAHTTQDPLRRYGQNAFRKMKRISRTVDPAQIYQSRLAGGFKLGGS